MQSTAKESKQMDWVTQPGNQLPLSSLHQNFPSTQLMTKQELQKQKLAAEAGFEYALRNML